MYVRRSRSTIGVASPHQLARRGQNSRQPDTGNPVVGGSGVEARAGEMEASVVSEEAATAGGAEAAGAATPTEAARESWSNQSEERDTPE